MTVAAIRWVRAETTGRPIYRCDDCGVTAAGSNLTDVYEFEGSAEDVSEHLRYDIIPHNFHIPVGWSGYGPTTHKCPRCKK